MSTELIRLETPLVIVRSKRSPVQIKDALSDVFRDITVEPYYSADQLAVLARLAQQAHDLTPDYVPPDFALTYRLRLSTQDSWTTSPPDDHVATWIRDKLLAIDSRATVSVHTVVAPFPVSDGNLAEAPDLLHLDPGTVGLGVEAVWATPGGRGEGEVLADVEGGWHTEHEEFAGIPATPESPGTPGVSFTELPGGLPDDEAVPHGTKVLSTAVGRENSKYGLGVAPGVTTVILSAIKRADSGDYDIVKAIQETIASMPPGSVMLLELELSTVDAPPGVPDGLLGPCEMDVLIFEAIELAVANHIIVVEAAGNGASSKESLGVGLDLDDHEQLLHGDSGAILVGQSKWSSAGGHVSMPLGCTGNRIDCFSWGWDVYAASAHVVSPGTYSDTKTSSFNGTSSASAIIAGAALVVQGLARHGAAGALGYLPPMPMRSLLGNRAPGVNTPLQDMSVDTIGVQPDLKNIATELGLLPDLYIRDNLGDEGGPHTGMLSRSPDIILRTSPLVDLTPDEAYGEGSETEDNEFLSTDPVEGETEAELFVRVRNRGGGDVSGALVSVYYAKPATLVQPNDWTPIGTAYVDVPQGDTIEVAGPISWSGVPTAGHYCLIATVEHESDKLFVPSSYKDMASFKAHIRKENNVAWRNFNVVPVSDSGSSFLTATVIGAAQQDTRDPEQPGEPMELRIEARLPRGATLAVELPDGLRARMSLPEDAFHSGKPTAIATVGATRLGIARLRTREAHDVTLHVQLPKGRKRRRAVYEVALIQLHEGQPLGRVTWRLVTDQPTSA